MHRERSHTHMGPVYARSTHHSTLESGCSPCAPNIASTSIRFPAFAPSSNATGTRLGQPSLRCLCSDVFGHSKRLSLFGRRPSDLRCGVRAVRDAGSATKAHSMREVVRVP